MSTARWSIPYVWSYRRCGPRREKILRRSRSTAVVFLLLTCATITPASTVLGERMGRAAPRSPSPSRRLHLRHDRNEQTPAPAKVNAALSPGPSHPGSDEQMFGAKQQVTNEGQSD